MWELFFSGPWTELLYDRWGFDSFRAMDRDIDVARVPLVHGHIEMGNFLFFFSRGMQSSEQPTPPFTGICLTEL